MSGNADLIAQRLVEARILAPVLAELTDALGTDRAVELLRRAVARTATEAGRALRGERPEGDLHGIAQRWRRLATGAALELETLEETPTRLHLRVTRCRYLEAYRAQGLEPLAEIVSCNRDEPFLQGYSDRLVLHRSQHLLAGDPCCELVYLEVP